MDKITAELKACFLWPIIFFCIGKCQCIDNHCYEDKYCKKDTEECANTTCALGNTCIDLDCVGPAPGTCIRMSIKYFYMCLHWSFVGYCRCFLAGGKTGAGVVAGG